MSDERFARQYRFELPSQFPVTSPCTSIVHHLSGPSIGALARQRGGPTSLGLPCARFTRLGQYSVSLRVGVCHPNTRTHVRLLGPCFKTGRISPAKRHDPGRAALSKKRGARRCSDLLDSGPAHAAATPEGCVWRAWWRGPGPSCLPVGARGPQGRAALIRLLPTISRTISLSFQSPFHLSLTVLVHYRSLASSSAFEGHYLRIGAAVPSNTTHWWAAQGGAVRTGRGSYPLRLAISTTNCTRRPWGRLPRLQRSGPKRPRLFKLSWSRFTRRYWGNPG